MRTLRIAIVSIAVTKYDGQGSVNLEVALAALRAGHHVTVIAETIDDDLKAFPTFRWVRAPVSLVPTDLLRNLAFSLFCTQWLQRHRRNFEIVHANGFVSLGPADTNAAHFVFSEWVSSPDMRPTGINGVRSAYHRVFAWLNAFLEKGAYRRAKRLVAVSDAVKVQLIRHAGVRDERVVVIPNGVRTDTFVPLPPDRARFGIPENDRPLLLFAGDLMSARKNLDAVLDALELVPNVHLAVAGDAAGSRYPELVRKRDLTDRVQFLGHCTDMPALMSTADMFVLLSHYEPFGLVVLQAMACGTPVVVAANVGAASLVTPESGFVIPMPLDTNHIAAAFRALADQPEMRRAQGREARRIAERYSLRAMAEAYVRLFEREALEPTEDREHVAELAHR